MQHDKTKEPKVQEYTKDKRVYDVYVLFKTTE